MLVARTRAPAEDGAVEVGGDDDGRVSRDADAAERAVDLGAELGGALAGRQVPDAQRAAVVGRDELGLVRVQADAVHGGARVVVALRARGARVPDAHGAVLAAAEEPAPVALPADGGDVARVALIGHEGVGRLARHVVEPDQRVAARHDVRAVGRDGQRVDLPLRVREGAQARARRRVEELREGRAAGSTREEGRGERRGGAEAGYGIGGGGGGGGGGASVSSSSSAAAAAAEATRAPRAP